MITYLSNYVYTQYIYLYIRPVFPKGVRRAYKALRTLQDQFKQFWVSILNTDRLIAYRLQYTITYFLSRFL